MIYDPDQLRPFMTRIPEHLRKRLAKAAKASYRSMNKEIILRLEDSFEREDWKKERRLIIDEAWRRDQLEAELKLKAEFKKKAA